MPDSPLFAVPMLEGGSDYPTPDATADAKQINDQIKYAEQFWGVKPVTSGTLPGSPKIQQFVVETDTGKAKYWNGSTWVVVAEPASSFKGTTSQRDTAYPTPGNAAARVALANAVTLWWNTDKGYQQQYFAQFDDAGVGANTPVRQVHGWGPAQDVAEVPLKPGSVGTTGGTAVLHGGKVEFTNSTVLNVNSIFSADFTNYRAILELDSGSVDAGLQFRMRAGGTDLTTSTYGINQIENTAAGSLGGGAPGSATSGLLGRMSGTGDSAQEFLIVKPFAAKRTSVFGHSIDATLFQRLFSTSVQNTVSYDGFTIIFNTAATGRLRFYGINDY